MLRQRVELRRYAEPAAAYRDALDRRNDVDGRSRRPLRGEDDSDHFDGWR